jgi:hypothetical protein
MQELIKIKHINFKLKLKINKLFWDINVFNQFDVILKTSTRLWWRFNNKNHNEIKFFFYFSYLLCYKRKKIALT